MEYINPTPKDIANFVMNDLLGILNKRKISITQFEKLIDDNQLSCCLFLLKNRLTTKKMLLMQ